MKKLILSIGIPAYNEAANIVPLLNNLLAQKQRYFELKEIIVSSDGSTDGTVGLANSINDPRIKVIDNKDRQGQTARQNQILNLFKADAIVLLNADILPAHNDFLDQLVKPFSQPSRPSIISCKGIHPQPKTFIEAVLNFSDRMKNDMVENMNRGDNIYLCHGFARAFSRDLAKRIQWPRAVGEDAYSYLFAKSRGYKFMYQPQASILYRAPQTIKDHLKQSVRFGFSQEKMSKLFPDLNINKEYKIPLKNFLKSTLKFLITNPLYFAAYILIQLFGLFNPFKVTDSNLWEPSRSSKTITN